MGRLSTSCEMTGDETFLFYHEGMQRGSITRCVWLKQRQQPTRPNGILSLVEIHIAVFSGSRLREPAPMFFRASTRGLSALRMIHVVFKLLTLTREEMSSNILTGTPIIFFKYFGSFSEFVL